MKRFVCLLATVVILSILLSGCTSQSQVSSSASSDKIRIIDIATGEYLAAAVFSNGKAALTGQCPVGPAPIHLHQPGQSAEA